MDSLASPLGDSKGYNQAVGQMPSHPEAQSGKNLVPSSLRLLEGAISL